MQNVLQVTLIEASQCHLSCLVLELLLCGIHHQLRPSITMTVTLVVMKASYQLAFQNLDNDIDCSLHDTNTDTDTECM